MAKKVVVEVHKMVIKSMIKVMNLFCLGRGRVSNPMIEVRLIIRRVILYGFSMYGRAVIN